MKYKKTINIIIILFILYGIYEVFYYTALFNSGIHNVDLSYNMCNLETQNVNMSTVDKNSAGLIWDRNEMYTYGLKQIRTGVNRTIFNLILVFAGLYIQREINIGGI